MSSISQTIRRASRSCVDAHRRGLSTSIPVYYPRITSNRFSPSSLESTSTDDTSSSSATPSSSRPSGGKIRFPVNSYDGPDFDPKSALESARERAWYLEGEEPVSESPQKRQPTFTTFDPERTTTSSRKLKAQPLPPAAPEELEPLYEWLVSEDAAHVIDISSVRFLSTKEAAVTAAGMSHSIHAPEAEVGAKWDWVVTAVVKGRGKGVVGRAERALRLWLHKNPLARTPPKSPGVSNKLPRIPDWTDWSIVQIPHLGLSINLFTAEGRDRWDLEEMWAPAEEAPLRQRYPFGIQRPFGA